ncbi:ankyrin repeat protein [Indivirus ILV1]|uniref:Ankyrin repeat protein n=1 Tax=Indivirus ILV1 TaxID=1977633 RepID=A0A1V0SE82_9VIRU|nr:ankyrin repeat protein [Indivirus ILV1]
MFSRFFSNITEQIRKDIIRNAHSNNTDEIKNIIDTNCIDINDPNLTDDSKNTLLHLAVATNNANLAKYVIDKGINKQKKNIFNESALRMALKNQDENLIRLIIGSDSNDNDLKKEKESHKRTRDEFEKEKSNHQTTRTERDIAIYENDILTTENKKIKEDNLELQKTIRILRQSFKK